MSTRVLVTGASGFIGSRLAPALVDAGHEVRAMTRHPDRYDGAGEAVYGDVADIDSLRAALGGSGRRLLPRALAATPTTSNSSTPRRRRRSGTRPRTPGVRQIVYLGGLGDLDDNLSAHLRSRRDVEQLLGLGGVPVTVLRAAVVVGHGGHLLGDHPPAGRPPAGDGDARSGSTPGPSPSRCRTSSATSSACWTGRRRSARSSRSAGPRCCATSTCCGTPRRSRTTERRRSCRSRCSPRSCRRCGSRSSPTSTRSTARNLVDSMNNEVIVQDPAIRDLVPFELMTYDDAVRLALAERAAERGAERPTPRRDEPASRERDADGRSRDGQGHGRTMKRWPAHVGRALRPSWSTRCRATTGSPTRSSCGDGWSSGITLVVGATLLGFSLNVPPGNPAFYPLTIALAATWVIGGFASGPLHLGRIHFRGELRRPVIQPILIGLGDALRCSSSARSIVREIPLLRDLTENVLAFARYQTSLFLVALITVMNGIAEEIFFRGALFAAIGVWHPVAISTRDLHAHHRRDRQPDAGLLGGPARPAARPAATRERRHPGADPDALHLVADDAAGAAAGVRRGRLSRTAGGGQGGGGHPSGGRRERSPRPARAVSRTTRSG